MDDVVLCGATISFGDDYGDNFSTFRCDVGKGHAGFHQERGSQNKQCYILAWEGDYRQVKKGSSYWWREWRQPLSVIDYYWSSCTWRLWAGLRQRLCRHDWKRWEQPARPAVWRKTCRRCHAYESGNVAA